MADINDVVLIYLEDEPTVFARIENIEPDHKEGWYHVTFLFLQHPPKPITWIIRDRYINGDEFTMSDQRIRIEKLESYYTETGGSIPDTEEKNTTRSSKVVFLDDIRKKSKDAPESA